MGSLRFNVVISYDLNKEKNYESLEKLIKSFNHKKILETVYLIQTNESCSDIMSKIKDIVDEDDQVFVGELSDYNTYNISAYGDLFK